MIGEEGQDELPSIDCNVSLCSLNETPSRLKTTSPLNPQACGLGQKAVSVETASLSTGTISPWTNLMRSSVEESISGRNSILLRSSDAGRCVHNNKLRTASVKKPEQVTPKRKSNSRHWAEHSHPETWYWEQVLPGRKGRQIVSSMSRNCSGIHKRLFSKQSLTNNL